jgi:phage terminase large subunit
MEIQIPSKLQFFLKDKSRFKCVYGGRGSGKSESIARSLIVKSLQAEERILCAREFQISIADSVHKLLTDVIYAHGLDSMFEITKASIKSCKGSEFIFKGIRNNINEIKSLQGISICWVEEAQKVSENSWDVLIPTIRKKESEIWVSFNPDVKDDATYKRFVENKPIDCISVLCNYYDNPFFENTELLREMEHDKQFRPEVYQNKWLGQNKQNSEALIFKNKYEVKDFETADLKDVFENRFFFGCDWGFSNDPCALVRSYIQDNILFIDQEAGGVGIEFEQLKPFLFDKVEGSEKWNIYADCARPETISYCKRLGYKIESAPKWAGSVEDGIEYLKSFKKIIIHPRCKQIVEEMGFYSFKTDRITGEPLPIIVDKYNHYIDALRYSLSKYIKKNKQIVSF